MSLQVISWSPKEWEDNLRKRLQSCDERRAPWEDRWNGNASVVYNAFAQDDSRFNITFDSMAELESGEVDERDSELGTNYVFRYVKFRHGQISANPPMAVASPTSPDYSDRLSADAADRIIQHGYKDQQVQEKFEHMVLKALIRGTGWMKIVWDKNKGDVADFNRETNILKMKGDIVCYSPRTADIWVDPLARNKDDVRFIFEAHNMPMEEAIFMFPGAEKELRSAVINQQNGQTESEKDKEEVVRIYEYWEKAAPINGMAGRHAWCTDQGRLVAKPEENPHINGQLPYHLLTDADIEDEVYGKSLIEYVARQQEMLNRFDSGATDAMLAHGNIRLLVAESTELNDDEISDSSRDIIKYSGAIPPHHIPAPSLPPDMARLREQMRADIQEMMGINDAQLGNIKRETSGFAQQTSIEAGNIANRRLYNKYTKVVEDFWKDYMGLVRNHWTVPRMILVTGKNKASESYKYSKADVAGGYDVTASYGTSLPLDPNMRREQIMLLMEPMKEAGIPMTRIMNLLKLGDLDTLYDAIEQGRDRQREIFEEMLAKYHKGMGNSYIAPQELEDHEAMLIFCQEFRMSMEYKLLPDDVQLMVEQHMKERMEMAAVVAGGGAQEAPAPAPMPMAPPQGILPIG